MAYENMALWLSHDHNCQSYSNFVDAVYIFFCYLIVFIMNESNGNDTTDNNDKSDNNEENKLVQYMLINKVNIALIETCLLLSSFSVKIAFENSFA